jgi:hypothetical protein
MYFLNNCILPFNAFIICKISGNNSVLPLQEKIPNNYK